jgi:hypothetical protein
MLFSLIFPEVQLISKTRHPLSMWQSLRKHRPIDFLAFTTPMYHQTLLGRISHRPKWPMLTREIAVYAVGPESAVTRPLAPRYLSLVPTARDPVDLGSTVRLCTRVGVQDLCQRAGKCLCRVAGMCGPAMDASAKAAGGPVTRHGIPQTWE